MKIALIITGQLRTYKLCSTVIKNNIIDKYDTDVFLSIKKSNKLQSIYLNDTEETNEDDINNAIDIYKPKDVFICSDYDSIFENIQLNKSIIENRLILEQYYMVEQGYKLLIKYVKTNNTKYDAIIRLRFDQYIWSSTTNILTNFLTRTPVGNTIMYYNDENIEKIKNISKNLIIEMDNPISNEIYVFGQGTIDYKYKWVNDQFWIHSMDLMYIMVNFYNNIPSIIDDVLRDNLYPTNCPYFELIFYVFLKNNNIDIKRSKIIGEFCREYIL
jgi:hypothetical protein